MCIPDSSPINHATLLDIYSPSQVRVSHILNKALVYRILFSGGGIGRTVEVEVQPRRRTAVQVSARCVVFAVDF
jgi:hypothetical protein